MVIEGWNKAKRARRDEWEERLLKNNISVSKTDAYTDGFHDGMIWTQNTLLGPPPAQPGDADAVGKPPHRRWGLESQMLEERHPRRAAIKEYIEDAPSGRVHLWPEDPPTVPGLVFDTAEDRNAVQELLLRIEDLNHAGQFSAMRKKLESDTDVELKNYVAEFLRLVDTIRSKKNGHDKRARE